MKTALRLKVSTIFALLSFPFWFVAARFREELQYRHPRSSATNLETPEALAVAAAMALITFGFFLFTLRERPRKP